MSITPPLSLSDIVDITVSVSPAAVSPNTFNQGLFIGPSAIIPSSGTNSRLRKYSNLTDILTDGFTTSSPEYIAAQLYFSQTQAATYIWIGRQDLTAISTLIPHSGAGGTGYVVGDIITVTQGGATNGQARVGAVTSGAVTALTVSAGTQGSGYSTATSLATTGGTGTGLTVDITAIGESLLQAAQACRLANSTWYGVSVNNPAVADNVALSQWADPLWQSTRYYAWSGDLTVPNAGASNVALQLQALKLKVIGVTSTTQGGLYPNNIYAAAALMGLEMGLNTGLASSFFTDAHKQLIGIAPEPLTETQYTNIKTAGWNAYCNFSPYQLFEPGFMSSGDPSYLWINLAMLVASLQINALNILQSLPAIPQTNVGQHRLIDACNAACDFMATIGFLSEALWEGVTIINLSPGQTVPGGYLNQSQSYALQSAGDRAAGKAMPIYTAITTSGAVQSLLIGVYTQL